VEKKAKGSVGEKLAALYLQRKGYKIVDTNWYCRWGEIDIIALDQEHLVFVEVKFRCTYNFGAASSAVHERKLRSLKRSIWRYLYLYDKFDRPCRLDVISIQGENGRYHLEHYRSVDF